MTPTIQIDPRIDRLYQLLPAIYRVRDVEQDYALQALLRVIAEQVSIVEDDIAQLYENWFIETAEDWAVPYIADLIGWKPVLAAGPEGDGATAESRALNRFLIPRREVANTMGARRRKGTVAVLDELARDVAGWPARTVEFFKKLGWNQNINHLHLQRARTVDVRKMEALDLISTPFDPFAHAVDVRRIDSTKTVGWYNIPSVGVFVWRLKSYSVTKTAPYCLEDAGEQCFSFSALGQNSRLFTKPEIDTSHSFVSGELSVPEPIRRYAFAHHVDDFYGPEKSLAIWAENWPGANAQGLIPASAIVPSDLSDWTYVPDEGKVAVDPIRGRFAFPLTQLPPDSVRVTYHYGFSADMGGGEYSRPTFNPTGRADGEPIFYYVGDGPEFPENGEHFGSIEEALAAWKKAKPKDAVVEILDSAVYVETIKTELAAGQTLQIRAASGKRVVIRLIDRENEKPDPLQVSMGEGSRFTLDGLIVTGRAVRVRGPQRAAQQTSLAPICGSRIVIRHCTLVPGWSTDCDCNPKKPSEPSLELFNVRAELRIEHSIVGAIRVHENAVTTDPIPVSISDSIVDATDTAREAIGTPNRAAHAVLCIERTTVFGIVNVHAIQRADDSIFMGCLNVARRQLGCMRFCYVPAGCRTPRRYHCQPDLVTEAVKKLYKDPVKQAQAIANERLRVRPQFTSSRYGAAGYSQLALTCAVEIKRGAEDESEIGAFHDLFQPQREANLASRLEEYTPAGMDSGIVFVT